MRVFSSEYLESFGLTPADSPLRSLGYSVSADALSANLKATSALSQNLKGSNGPLYAPLPDNFVVYANIDGSSGDDSPLDGTADDDVINGLAGNDVIYGLGGDDTLNGGDGDDNLVGGEGAGDLYAGG